MICPHCKRPLLISPALMGKKFVPFKDGKVEFELGCSVCKALFQVAIQEITAPQITPEKLAERKAISTVMMQLTCGCTVEWGTRCTPHKNGTVATWQGE